MGFWESVKSHPFYKAMALIFPIVFGVMYLMHELYIDPRKDKGNLTGQNDLHYSTQEEKREYSSQAVMSENTERSSNSGLKLRRIVDNKSLGNRETFTIENGEILIYVSSIASSGNVSLRITIGGNRTEFSNVTLGSRITVAEYSKEYYIDILEIGNFSVNINVYVRQIGKK